MVLRPIPDAGRVLCPVGSVSASQSPVRLLLKPGLWLRLPHCTGPSSTQPHQPWSPKAMAGFVDAGMPAPASEAREDRWGWIPAAATCHAEELKSKNPGTRGCSAFQGHSNACWQAWVSVLASESGS